GQFRVGADRAAPPPAAAAARRPGADAFRGADRHAGGHRLRGGRRTKDRDPRAGIVRARSPSGDCRRKNPAGDRTSVAGSSAGADDARPARLLARQLRGRAQRDARALPETSLAGRSDCGAADATGEAAGWTSLIVLTLFRSFPRQGEAAGGVVLPGSAGAASRRTNVGQISPSPPLHQKRATNTNDNFWA